MPVPLWIWITFNLGVLAMLALDLGVFHRKAHAVTMREALTWSAVWVTLALGFNGWLWGHFGEQAAVEFFTGYLIEKSLSVDNVFVFALTFAAFGVADQYQHRVLFWGILGALILRAGMIFAGAALIHSFSWIIYVFAAFLAFTGVKMLLARGPESDPRDNAIVRWCKRIMPVAEGDHGGQLMTRVNGLWHITTLGIVLIVVEVTDVIFAVDSIPAIFAVTEDPFIVYTSNVFAVLGLRSLYFALAGMMHRFIYLKVGLGVVLIFIGIKMALGHTAWAIPTPFALGFIAVTIALSVVASVLKSRPTSGRV
jgi:tellurite resistance protein TerC